ncbi:putative phenol hydroxylase, C-terminal dimerisation domain [Lyophyllum shimeji]|uniref:Phenol hydroxylase, C-terminal dimerisation domain n=1 Tax=Lyophyllum shimeji TaxID=47721 RepID=A0A9P3USY0_LYOSH|nr:putative phenol hydroxylase, C-terminal dimerisation domain [Lyophyllum shimeji]
MPTSTTTTSEVDVLIIGAGPAGLMACNALAKAGINVRIVDKRPQKIGCGHADGFQPRTMEVLQSYGLCERLLREANQMHLAAFYNPNPVTGGIELTDRTPDIPEPSARYPFEALLHQGALEDIFIDSMKESGVEVCRPIMPVSIQIVETEKDLTDLDAHPVRVVLKRLDSLEGQTDTEVVRAKYVIGADGAHSWVRRSFNIEMEGEQTDYVWGVVDMIPDTDLPDIRNKCAIHSNHGSCMLIPREGDKVRLYIQVGSRDALDPTSGRLDKDQMNPEKLLNIARKAFAPYYLNTPKDIEWWTMYRIGQRVAARFAVDNRVFIAGDACHTHSPKAGQGMNASMNDTHNLAWKLVHVIRGWADPSIMTTYELERRKYAQDLIAFDKQFARMFSGKIKTAGNEDGDVSVEEFTRSLELFSGISSGIGIIYQQSAIVDTRHQSVAKNLIIGKRLPPQLLVRAADHRPFELQDLVPSDTRFKVLVFTGDIYEPIQKDRLAKLAVKMGANDAFLKRYSPGGDIFAAFDILAITMKKEEKMVVRHTDLPDLFRTHWSKVFIDTKPLRGMLGGDAYSNFGIEATGAVVIVRPDGYVGMVAPFERIGHINAYFAQFSK